MHVCMVIIRDPRLPFDSARRRVYVRSRLNLWFEIAGAWLLLDFKLRHNIPFGHRQWGKRVRIICDYSAGIYCQYASYVISSVSLVRFTNDASRKWRYSMRNVSWNNTIGGDILFPRQRDAETYVCTYSLRVLEFFKKGMGTSNISLQTWDIETFSMAFRTIEKNFKIVIWIFRVTRNCSNLSGNVEFFNFWESLAAVCTFFYIFF